MVQFWPAILHCMRALELDRESARWVHDLASTGDGHDAAVARLHGLLLRVARREAARRRPTLPPRTIEELDDICVQSTNDALVALLSKIDTFRGTARFTTWACKFVIFELSAAIRRHAWRKRDVSLDDAGWDRLPDSAPPAIQKLQNAELLAILDRAVREQLTERQRIIFRSVTMDDVPIDVLAERLGGTRGSIYKMMYDARAKIRRALADAGYGTGESAT